MRTFVSIFSLYKVVIFFLMKQPRDFCLEENEVLGNQTHGTVLKLCWSSYYLSHRRTEIALEKES